MKNFLYHSILALLLPLSILAWGQAAAGSQAFEFHADARMEHATRGPVENAYGYMYALTDKKGHGAVKVADCAVQRPGQVRRCPGTRARGRVFYLPDCGRGPRRSGRMQAHPGNPPVRF